MAQNITEEPRNQIIKHGNHFLAMRGLTSQKKYAKLYTKVEAEAIKKHYDAKRFPVEIIGLEE